MTTLIENDKLNEILDSRFKENNEMLINMMNTKFDENNKILINMMNAKFDENNEKLINMMNTKLDETSKKWDAKFDETSKKWDAKFDETSKVLAATLKSFEEFNKRLNNVEIDVRETKHKVHKIKNKADIEHDLNEAFKTKTEKAIISITDKNDNFPNQVKNSIILGIPNLIIAAAYTCLGHEKQD